MVVASCLCKPTRAEPPIYTPGKDGARNAAPEAGVRGSSPGMWVRRTGGGIRVQIEGREIGLCDWTGCCSDTGFGNRCACYVAYLCSSIWRASTLPPALAGGGGFVVMLVERVKG
jgi:hypothetical protein